MPIFKSIFPTYVQNMLLSSLMSDIKFQPKVPDNEHATGEQCEMNKKKRADKHAIESSQPDSRQPPPKPPRKGKLSTENITSDVPIEHMVQGTAFNNAMDPSFERNGQLEGKREGSRKRNKKEDSHCAVFENCEKSTQQKSCGKSDDSIGYGEIATKKTKQCRLVSSLLFHF